MFLELFKDQIPNVRELRRLVFKKVQKQTILGKV